MVKKKSVMAFLETCKKGEDLEPWEGTLTEYFEMVRKDPKLGQTSHSYVWNMIKSAGIEFKEEDVKKEHPIYKFFTDELYGVNDTISKTMEYFNAAAQGSDVSRRLLLLYGPTSSGKSQFAILMKEGLEAFSRTKDGRIFAIDGCPMNGNPLCAIPKSLRPQLLKEYGIHVDGDVSPPIRWKIDNELKGRWQDLKVKRIFFSEMQRVGIGTFQPADPKNQNMSELIGSLNYARITEYGSESHPLAYDFNGELNIANRGMMEFIELLKVDRKFRHVLLTLAQEKKIKSDRFPLVHADEVLLGHSVVGDSPVPYRKYGQIKFSTIAELTEKNDTDIEVLAAGPDGKPTWTGVKSFFKHQFTGKLVKTIQEGGIVETTDSHSLIGKDLKPFLPEEKKDILAFRELPEISEQKTKGRKSFAMKSFKDTLDVLKKLKQKTENITGKFTSEIESYLNKNRKVRELTFKLNVDNGVYSTSDKMKAAQMAFLSASLGKDFIVNYYEDGTYFLNFFKNSKSSNLGFTNRIETREVEDITVYDIECKDNHSFVAGVGNVVCHNTNETEYRKFLAQQEEEALHDRIWVIRFPYNLKMNEEVMIYEKMIARAQGFKGIHIAPHTLKVAAMFAVLSRLEIPKDVNVSILKKMHLYNGEDVDGVSGEDMKRMMEDVDREGMEGISPRYIINRLSACFTKYGVKYVSPIDTLRSIKDGFGTNAKLSKEDIERYENLISLVIEEYNKLAFNEVQKAFFLNFEGEIKNLLNNYIDNALADLDGRKVENEWGDFEEPDIRLLRSVEEKIGISVSGAETFRQEVTRKMLRMKSETGEYDYQTHARLREALQKQLFAERSDTIRLTVTTRNPDPEALKRKNEVIAALVDHHNYTPESANELLRYVSNIMAKNN